MHALPKRLGATQPLCSHAPTRGGRRYPRPACRLVYNNINSSSHGSKSIDSNSSSNQRCIDARSTPTRCFVAFSRNRTERASRLSLKRVLPMHHGLCKRQSPQGAPHYLSLPPLESVVRYRVPSAAADSDACMNFAPKTLMIYAFLDNSLMSSKPTTTSLIGLNSSCASAFFLVPLFYKGQKHTERKKIFPSMW